MSPRLVRVVTLVYSMAAVVAVRASGPEISMVQTVESSGPAARAEYARGRLGIVRPSFASRHLAQAYRVLNGAVPLAALTFEPWERNTSSRESAPVTPEDQWARARRAAMGQQAGDVFRYRESVDYQSFENCLGDALMSAARTLGDRVRRYGAGHAAVAQWVQAQDVVFSNCDGTELRMPDPAPASADALAQADRAYQRAAALFYATRYDEAARAFTAIANDASSPWQPYGRYLTARAFIRHALVTESEGPARDRRLAAAEAELRAVLATPAASALHASAHGLLDLIAARRRPVERLQVLARVLASAPAVTDQQVTDFSQLMNGAAGDTVDYEYGQIRDRDALSVDPMLDWITAMQAAGDAALVRSLRRWEETGSPAWLVAVLWKLPPRHAAADSLLKAAIVDVASPAHGTLTFLRLRLLIERGDTGEARRLLASLPNQTARGADIETVNLYRAARMRLARTFGEFLASAPRTSLDEPSLPVFDTDATLIFSDALPLDRLVAAAASSMLPGRLRVRVAMAAFTRAVRLGRDDAAQRVAPVLRELAPQLRGELDRYLAAATAADRHIWALKLLLRTPGASDVVPVDDTLSIQVLDPTRRPQTFGSRWWCSRADETLPGDSSTMFPLMYRDGVPPSTPFLSEMDRRRRQEEGRALQASAEVFSYLTAETLAWVRARPDDPDAPEALAQAIHGVRWGCGGDAALSRQAFRLLHQRYAGTPAARRTRYWYAN